MSTAFKTKLSANKLMAVLALSVAGGSIYLIPYIRYVFYDYMVEVMGVTNQQIGLLSSAYAISCMALYIPGGIISDKYSTKNNIILSLISTTIVTAIYGFTMKNYSIALFLWFLMGFSTAFVFWGSLYKTLRIIGDADEQGMLFGLYYMGNGLTGAIVNFTALRLASSIETVDGKFFAAVMAYAVSTLIAAVMVYFLVPKTISREDELGDIEESNFKFSQVRGILKTSTIWLFSIIIFSGYAIYSSASYFTPYLTEVVGITAESSGLLSIIRNNIFYIIAPVSGLVVDKVFKSTSKWFMMLFTVLAILYGGVMLLPAGISPTFASIYSLLPGLCGLALYGVAFSIAEETKIPISMMATATGIASIIGYFPDFFMSAMYGSWLDKYGAEGYNLIFAFVISVSVVGFIAAYIIRKKSKQSLKI